MIRIILIGILMTCLCFLIQAAAGFLSVRLSHRNAHRRGLGAFLVRMSNVLAVLFLGIVAQMAAWAAAWRALGQFASFEEAFYFSGVTFTSLGYGDVVVKGTVRLLAPLEATTGLIMFALLTAVFVNLVQRELTGRGPGDL